MESSEKKRYALEVFGVVQGVGYRPYVYNKAKLLNITGWVTNRGSALVADIEGGRKAIKEFLLQVVKNPPKLASIEKVRVTPKEYVGHSNFSIIDSSRDEGELKFIGMDAATCPDCLRDIFDKDNLRYRYAFTNCTACGPRYSIIKKLPYDRVNTTMESFSMCPVCHREYADPVNRRFHAQPNCCPNCGPTLKLLNQSGGEAESEDAVKDAVKLLKEGKILAIKGLGGFHLACDAENRGAVELLRSRKNRPHKPFAIMVKDIKKAKTLCHVSDEEEKLLLSNKRPIVILAKKDTSTLPEAIAPNLKKLGIMLPYTPMHYLLFEEGISYLVMTSGNVSSAPIEYENFQGIRNLGRIADFFLIHNRDINIPVEDSVVKVFDNREIVIRRGRGYSPHAMNMKARHEILALGAEQKNTFCLSQNGYGYMSQYLGDLKDFNAYNTYTKAIENLESLLDAKPEILAHDLHPMFLSSMHAEYLQRKRVLVQHHHAHMVSCMVEHNLYSPVIGVVFDGTGLGSDGNIWGGEFFLGTRKDFIRAGHFKYVTIQGGDQSIKEPWRIALSYLHELNIDPKGILKGIEEEKLDMVGQALERKLNCYKSSSLGRLFDCISSLLNIRHKITYDAQGAIELENILDDAVSDAYEYEIIEENGIRQIFSRGIIFGVLKDMEKGTHKSIISAKFHNTIGNAAVEMVNRISESCGVKSVVLSGGVFENNYLLQYVLKKMVQGGFAVYHNEQIPINDGGISVGQLAIADAGERE